MVIDTKLLDFSPIWQNSHAGWATAEEIKSLWNFWSNCCNVGSVGESKLTGRIHTVDRIGPSRRQGGVTYASPGSSQQPPVFVPFWRLEGAAQLRFDNSQSPCVVDSICNGRLCSLFLLWSRPSNYDCLWLIFGYTYGYTLMPVLELPRHRSKLRRWPSGYSADKKLIPKKHINR